MNSKIDKIYKRQLRIDRELKELSTNPSDWRVDPDDRCYRIDKYVQKRRLSNNMR